MDKARDLRSEGARLLGLASAGAADMPPVQQYQAGIACLKTAAEIGEPPPDAAAAHNQFLEWKERFRKVCFYLAHRSMRLPPNTIEATDTVTVTATD